MALRDNFKDALDDIVNMFDNPKAQKVIGALSSSVQPASQGRVAENLSVPFGASFDQGQALRGSAQQIDAQTDARIAAERQAQLEAQRVALEGRRVSESEKAGEHTRTMNDMSTFEQIQAEQDFQVVKQDDQQQHEISLSDQNYVQSADLEYLRAANDLDNSKALITAESESPLGMAKVREINANIDATAAQADYYRAMAVDKLAESELATATRNASARLKMDGKGVPTPETILDFNTAYMNIQKAVVEELSASAEADEIIRRKGITLFKQGYSIGAVPVEVFENVLSQAEMQEMYRLDAIWQKAKQGIEVEKYMAEKNRIYADLLDNGKIDKSNQLNIDPFDMGGVGPLRPPEQSGEVNHGPSSTPGYNRVTPRTGVPGSTLKAPPKVPETNRGPREYERLQAEEKKTAKSLSSLSGFRP